MKLINTILICLLSAVTYSQIDFDQFKGTWQQCISESQMNLSDTMTFMKSDSKEKCTSNWQSEYHIHNEVFEYSFFDKDSMSIYQASGIIVKEEYASGLEVKPDTIIDSLGNTEIIRNMIQFGAGGSSATVTVSSYKLKKDENKLEVIDNGFVQIYEIIQLSKEKLILKKSSKLALKK